MGLVRLSRQWRRHLVAWVVVLAGILPRPSVAQITVGKNVQVSRVNAQVTHEEFISASDPNDASRIMVCSDVFPRGVLQTAVYASFDGGNTWQETLHTDQLAGGGDPACAYGVHNDAYYAVLGGLKDAKPDDKEKFSMWIYRSSDAGKTWEGPVGLPGIDREYLIADNTQGKYRGRIYMNGTGFMESFGESDKLGTSALYVYATEDGRVIRGPAQRASLSPRWILGMANSVVLSDGTLASLFGEFKTMDLAGEMDRSRTNVQPNGVLRVVTSDDGGTTLKSGSTVSQWYMHRPRSEGGVIPMIAADPGSAAFKDRLYVVWADIRSEHLQILLAYSADKGKTWSTPRVMSDEGYVGDPAKGPDAITPVVAVNPAGVVGVAWADRRDSPDNLGWWYRFTASLDGGETFLPSVKVSEAANTYGGNRGWTPAGSGGPTGTGEVASINFSIGADIFLYNAGHTGGMSADPSGVFHPVWVDNRTGVAQIWTSAVKVAGNVIKHGSAELADLDDIADKLKLEVDNTDFDAAKNLVTLTVRLKNTSKETVIGPVKGRVRRTWSGVGSVAIVDADNHLAGEGAVWDFSSLLNSGQLKPEESSQTRKLVFQLSNVHQISANANYSARALAHADIVMLGKTKPAESAQEGKKD
jgi:hypothetical protein